MILLFLDSLHILYQIICERLKQQYQLLSADKDLEALINI